MQLGRKTEIAENKTSDQFKNIVYCGKVLTIQLIHILLLMSRCLPSLRTTKPNLLSYFRFVILLCTTKLHVFPHVAVIDFKVCMDLSKHNIFSLL